MTKEKPITEHLEEISQSSTHVNNDTKNSTAIDITNPDVEQKVVDDSLFNDATKATSKEHETTFKESFKIYKKSIFWAMMMSATIIMEGYDNILMSSFFAYPSFTQKYGKELTPGDFQLSSSWQVALTCSGSAGTIVGTVCNGFLVERFGHRYVAMVALVFMAAFVFIPFFAKTVQHLLAGQILCGLTWGIFAVLGPSYSSEILNLNLRGYLTAYVNLCWATGQFVAAGVLRALVNNSTEWSYRIPFAVQWVWVLPLFVLSFFAPDSPQWLIRKGRTEDAIRAVKRLSHPSIHDKAHERIAMMIRTNEVEKQKELDELEKEYSQEGAVLKTGWRRDLDGYIKCFKGTDLRRTEIASIAFAGQVLSGSTFAYSPSYFFSQAGLNSDDTYKLNLGVTGIAWSGTVCSWFLLSRIGRRPIYVGGFTILTSVLLIIGALGSPSNQTSALKWTQCGIVLLWVATYALTIGPLAFVYSSEISSSRRRSHTVAIARGTYCVVSLISNIVEPYLINPGSGNLKGKTAYVWLATAVTVMIWSFFRLPETKDRTYEELDVLFEKKVPARQFAGYKIDLDKELRGADNSSDVATV